MRCRPWLKSTNVTLTTMAANATDHLNRAAERLGQRNPFPNLGLLHDRAASTQQIANQLGILTGSVSYHLKVLTRAGLVKLVNTRKVRGVTERFYGRTARGFDFTSAAAPVGARGFELRVVADDMEYATPRAADLVVVRRVRLSDDAVSALARELDALLDAVIDRADPSEPIRAVAVALYTPESG